jgi:uncharacterized OB-fold protein
VSVDVQPSVSRTEALHGDCWIAIDDRTAELRSYRCNKCGTHFLPSVMRCSECGGASFDRASLAQTGYLYSYTIIHGAGGVWPAVYAVGYVDFPEGARVFGQIRETDSALLAVGARVAIEPAVLYERKDGTQVKSFRFFVLREGQQ